MLAVCRGYAKILFPLPSRQSLFLLFDWKMGGRRIVRGINSNNNNDINRNER
jgi:hypothetical protein